MGTIGDTLREARMRQQIDIAEVEEATKIRAKYLRALENEEFSLLPDAPRVRSFLRTYAEWLGLDARMLVEEYRANYEPGGEVGEVHPVSRPTRRRREGRPERRPPGRGALIIVAVVALVAFLAILGLANDDDGGGGGSEKKGDDAAQRERAQERRRERQRERERAEARERAEEAARRRAKVGIAPPDDGGGTYVCVDNGAGEILFEGTLSEPQTFRGKRIRINLGRRASEVRLNDEKVEIEQSADPIALDFKAGEKRPNEIDDEPSPCA